MVYSMTILSFCFIFYCDKLRANYCIFLAKIVLFSVSKLLTTYNIFIKMKTIVYIIKGILMYATLIYWILAVCLADSFTSTGLLIVFGIGFTLICICRTVLTVEDVAKLTGSDPKEIENETV